jgi:Ca2+-binding RTX toxin-like protein
MRRFGLLPALALAIPLLAAGSAQATENVTCNLVATGPAGPAGDVLEVVDLSRSVTHVYREDEAIVVSNNADSERAICGGGAPTVTTVDRIEYSSANGVLFLNYSGATGPLEPGASAEPGAEEIEVSLDLGYDSKVLNVGGTAAAEKIEVGQLGRAAIGVNLNAQADGSAQDADVTMAVPAAAEAYVRVVAKDGDDTLSSLGGPAFTAPISVERLVLSGGPGDDVLNGGPFRDALSGNDGDDQLFGGRGSDKLQVGPGRDLALGGKGGDDIENISDVGGIAEDLLPDRIFGGAGNDSISASQELGGDHVDCGAGARDDVFIDVGDLVRSCEDVDRR